MMLKETNKLHKKGFNVNILSLFVNEVVFYEIEDP